MKKTLIALAAVAVSSAAMAQVTIDGSVDLGIVKPLADDNASRLDATNGANQIRFRGTEDLGGGMKASFVLAQRFSPESGSNDGSTNTRPLFQGESTLGLSGSFGSVRLGRALTALQATVNATDPWGTLQVASTAILVNGYVTDPNANTDSAGLARTDAIHYTSPTFGGVTASVSYGPKKSRAAATDTYTGTKNLTSLWVSYAAGPLSIGAGTETNRRDDKVTAVLASYNFGVATVGAGYSVVDTVALANDQKNYNLMAAVPMGNILFKAGYAHSKAENAAAATSKKTGLGIDYNLSKRTKVYTSWGREAQRTTNKTGYDIGVRHTF